MPKLTRAIMCQAGNEIATVLRFETQSLAWDEHSNFLLAIAPNPENISFHGRLLWENEGNLHIHWCIGVC